MTLSLTRYKKAFNQLNINEYFYINALNVTTGVIDYLKEQIKMEKLNQTQTNLIK